MLPDDVLIEIFNSNGHDDEDESESKREKAWRTLVHVCQRWRCIVFGSPRHLNLQLVCRNRTPARDMLDVWPAFPTIILSDDDCPRGPGSRDNIIAALKCTDRVCQIDLHIVDSDIFCAMQQPFPELTSLELWSTDGTVVVPDSFLSGSAPNLEHLTVSGIPFPGLPKLLLSATHLVFLYLVIPHSGYISPDEMVAALSILTELKAITIEFKSPRSCPDPASRRPPPKTRSVLVLKHLWFKGVSEYLDDLVACIAAPQLSTLSILFFNDTVFDTPQLVRFISHTPMSEALETAHITLQDRDATVRFSSQKFRGDFSVTINCKRLDWQVSSLEQVCTSCLPPLSSLQDLYFHDQPRWTAARPADWKDSVENRHWLEPLRPFIAVKNLYLSEKFTSRIGPALQELVEGRTTDVLPALQNIFLKGLKSSRSFQESTGEFVAARQATNHPIVISPWIDSIGKDLV